MSNRVAELREERFRLLTELAVLHLQGRNRDRWRYIDLTGRISDLEIEITREIQDDLWSQGLAVSLGEVCASMPGYLDSLGLPRPVGLS